MGTNRTYRKLTNGDITRIVELYAAGRTYDEISRAIGIARGNISRVLRGAGIELDRRRTESSSKKTVVERVCPRCRREIPVAEARFCSFCGADVRTERMRCAEDLEHGMQIVADMSIPAEQKDRFMNALRSAVRLPREDKEE